MPIKFLRLPSLTERYDVCRSTVYNYIDRGLWVRPVALGPRVVAWPAHEIDAIIEARMRGADDEQVRTLVAQLHAARRSQTRALAQ